MPLSVLLDDFWREPEVCLSVPVVVGRSGVVRQLHPRYSEPEELAFRASATAVRRAIAKLPRLH